MNKPAANLLPLPRHWTPPQALAALELLDLLRDRLWALYGLDIQQAWRDEHLPPIDPRQLCIPLDPDNDPF